MSGPGGDDVSRTFAEILAGMSSSDLEELTRQILAADAVRRAPLPPPSRRRPRSASAYTLRVRAELEEARPPLWRRLELTSSLMLDELHDILQAAFGWEDRHLHRFAVGGSVYDIGSEKFLCPEDVEEGDTAGVPAGDVRLDEVLAAVGDKLTYAYDYGDGWEVALVVEAVLPRAVDDDLRAVCTDGRRGDVREDSGGPTGHDARARRHPNRDRFDITTVNHRLAAALAAADMMMMVPPLLLDIPAACGGTPLLEVLGDAIRDAELHVPVDPDPETVRRAMVRFQWLLDLVGDDGVALTSAGRLAPAHVEQAYAELGIADEWYGKGNREANVIPVVQMRESSALLGLVRRYRGRLVATKAGARVREDPQRLFEHVAGSMPYGEPDSLSQHAAVLELLLVAAGWDLDDRARSILNGALNAYGWTVDGRPLEVDTYVTLMHPVDDVLHVARAFEWGLHEGRYGVVTPEGRTLARSALQRLAPSSGSGA